MRTTSRVAWTLALSLCLLFSASASAGAAEKRLKVALLPLEGRDGVSPILAEVVTESLAVELTANPGLSVITPKDIEAALGFEKQKAKLSATVAEQTGGDVCTENSCLQEIGGALGVDRTVSGTISRLGQSWVLTVQAFDPRKAEVVRRKLVRVSSDQQDALLDVVPSVADELFPNPGRVRAAPRPAATAVQQPQPIAPAAAPVPAFAQAPASMPRPLVFRLAAGDAKIRVKVADHKGSRECPKEISGNKSCSLDVEPGNARVSISGDLQHEQELFLPAHVKEIIVQDSSSSASTYLIMGGVFGGIGAAVGAGSLALGCELRTGQDGACLVGMVIGGTGLAMGAIYGLIGVASLSSPPTLIPNTVVTPGFESAEAAPKGFGEQLLSGVSIGASQKAVHVGTSATF